MFCSKPLNDLSGVRCRWKGKFWSRVKEIFFEKNSLTDLSRTSTRRKNVEPRKVERIPTIRGSTFVRRDNSISQLDCRKFLALGHTTFSEVHLADDLFSMNLSESLISHGQHNDYVIHLSFLVICHGSIVMKLKRNNV